MRSVRFSPGVSAAALPVGAARAVLGRVLAMTAIGVLTLSLLGCETTAERSATLAKRFHRVPSARPTSSVPRPSRVVKILNTALLHDGNGTAAVITLRNDGAHALRGVPIAIALKGANGSKLFQNNAAGLDPSLTSTPLLLPHRTSIWVDDQIPLSAFPATISALAGEAASSDVTPPRLDIDGARLVADPANGSAAQGTLINRSSTTQQNLVIFALARRGKKVVAAGRAVLASVPAHGSSPFQIYFIGNPTGAKLELSAPPSTLG